MLCFSIKIYFSAFLVKKLQHGSRKKVKHGFYQFVFGREMKLNERTGWSNMDENTDLWAFEHRREEISWKIRGKCGGFYMSIQEFWCFLYSECNQNGLNDRKCVNFLRKDGLWGTSIRGEGGKEAIAPSIYPLRLTFGGDFKEKGQKLIFTVFLWKMSFQTPLLPFAPPLSLSASVVGRTWSNSLHCFYFCFFFWRWNVTIARIALYLGLKK